MQQLRRVLDLRVRWQLPLVALIGALGALGQAPWGLWPLTLLSLALVYGLCAHAKSWRVAGRIAWAAGTGYFMLALFWIVEPFFVDAPRHGWMAPFALFFLSLGLAIFWAITGALTRASGGSVAAFVGGFGLVEAIRTYALTGFPWAQIGHVLIDTTLLQAASVIGSLGLTLLVVALSCGVWQLIARNWALGGALILVPLFLGLGVGLIPREDLATRADAAPVVRLIQPNAPQHEKWDPDKIPIFFERQIDFTAAPPEGPKPDLIVWPETAVPGVLERAAATLNVIAGAAQGTPVVLGIQRFDDQGFFNSLIRIDEQGSVSAVYDKHHLVPFGEYMPLRGVMARFGITGLAANESSGYTAGPGPQTIDMGDLGQALPLICYEGVFPHNVGGYEARPDFLLMITNDAWFGEASGPYQHLAQARLRSMEQGLPMVRVANTGVSAMIDARGQVVDSLPLGVAGWIDVPLPEALPETIYARVKDWPVIALALLLVAAAFVSAFQATDRGRAPRD